MCSKAPLLKQNLNIPFEYIYMRISRTAFRPGSELLIENHFEPTKNNVAKDFHWISLIFHCRTTTEMKKLLW